MTYFVNNVYRLMEILAAAPLTVNMIAEIYHEFNDETCARIRDMATKGVSAA
jgi:hypothetical protein